MRGRRWERSVYVSALLLCGAVPWARRPACSLATCLACSRDTRTGRLQSKLQQSSRAEEKGRRDRDTNRDRETKKERLEESERRAAKQVRISTPPQIINYEW